MRNFEQYAEQGQKRMKDNSRFDMQVGNLALLVSEIRAGKIQLEDALIKTFYAGVEAGARVENKRREAALDA